MSVNVLFLNVGRRCELVDAFRRALNARGGGRVHGSDVTDRAPALHKVDDAHILPHGSSPDFVAALCHLCIEEGIDLVIPTIDPDLEFLAHHRAEIERRCPTLRLLVSPSEVITLCRDKRLSRNRFASLGAEVPQAVDPHDPALEFPIFMKPPSGSASEGIHLIRDRAELAIYGREYPDAMFEKVVEGPEYTVDVLCDFVGRALVAMPRKRLKVRAGEVTQGIIERNADLEALAMRLAEGFGCQGPVTLQFRATPRFVAMEINARMGGGLPLSIAAGADWPGWILDLCTGKRPNLDTPIRDGMLVLRYDASVFVHTKAPKPAAPEPLGPIKAVIFDLDDTLYPERDFVYGGYRAVAERVFLDHGVDIEAALRSQFESGTRHNVFGLALQGIGVDEDYVRELVSVYRMHEPALRPYIGIAVLPRMRAAGYKLGLLTDGITAVQRNKVVSLGIERLFDAIVYSHELGGRDTWKPSPLPYQQCLATLGVMPGEAVYVADNPSKDFRGARTLGIKTIRIRHPGSEHTDTEPDTLADAPNCEIGSLTALADLLKL